MSALTIVRRVPELGGRPRRPRVELAPAPGVGAARAVVFFAPSVGGYWHATWPAALTALCGAQTVAPYVARADVGAAGHELVRVEGCHDCARKLRRFA